MLQFQTPAAAGGAATLALSVGGQRVDPTITPQSLTIQYYPPTVSSIALFDNDPLFDCTNAVESVGARNATLVVYGANFGTGEQTSVTINGQRCDILGDLSSHVELYFLTSLCRGTVAVVVAGKSAPTIDYSYELLVALPAIAAITPLSGPTAGGTVVTITGTQFQFRGTVTFVDADQRDIGVCEYNGIEDMGYSPLQIKYVVERLW